MKTYMPKAADIKRDWLLVDAKDVVLGRLASRIAHLMLGKHKTIYAAHADVGDFIIVINAGQIKLTGRKHTQKQHYWFTGYPGGLKSVSYGKLLIENPEKLVLTAVKNMIPKTHSSHHKLARLRVYPGAEHPHTAQLPKTVTLDL